MPVLCLLYTYSEAEERERRKRLADLLGLGSGIVDTPSYTSRVVKPRHRLHIIQHLQGYLHTLGFDQFKHAISLGHIHFIYQRPSKLRR